MPSETDNLILVQLREIRATLDRHEKRFDALDHRFDAVDKSLETLKFQMTYTRRASPA